MVKKLKVVRINARHMEKLKKLAKKEDETVSFLIQQAAREFLEKSTKGIVMLMDKGFTDYWLQPTGCTRAFAGQQGSAAWEVSAAQTGTRSRERSAVPR